MDITLYLDVDGVLAPYCVKLNKIRKLWPDIEGKTEFEVTDATGQRKILREFISRELVRRLCFLDVELVWATTWEAQANKITEKFGFHNDYRHIPCAEKTESGLFIGYDKYEAVIAEAEERHNALVWIDDCFEPQHLHWGEKRSATIPTLLIPTKPNFGLYPEEVTRVEDFVEYWRKVPTC